MKDKNPCWDGYERVPGTKKFDKGSCRKKTFKKWSEWLVLREESKKKHKGKKKCSKCQYVFDMGGEPVAVCPQCGSSL